ncbi:MAG: Penicillin-binding protein 2 [Chlamydiae bacterium]|nr:Penicillin-binding protein 2 [Chlamydiota bacterium]
MSRKKRFRPQLNIPDKANRILNIILIAMLLIIIRVWHLAVIQYDDKIEEAAKPRKRVVIVPANRATIRDRFNIPLAINKVKYQATVYYSQIKEIPSIRWELTENGKKVRRFKRREYIKSLSDLLGGELTLDPERIEDLIHSKAVFYNNFPFVIKEDISESEYYRLKMLEKDWPGICARRVPKRHYPKGRVAAEIIGYMGSINREEYDLIIEEILSLRETVRQYEEEEEPFFPENYDSIAQVKKRLRDLEEHAYSINDYVGKSGIEGRYEDELRGYYGRKVYYSDAKGNHLHELPGARAPIAGNRLLLSISADLQEYAEQLLIRNEQTRESRWQDLHPKDARESGVASPWIRGGAIIVMDPKSGDILALAGFPRFDPNDFIATGSREVDQAKREHIRRWFEGEDYTSSIWDQFVPLEREEYDPETDTYTEKQITLTWDHYLDLILPNEHEVRLGLQKIRNIRGAVDFQRHVEQLLALSSQANILALFDAVYHDEIHYRSDWDAEKIEKIQETLNQYPVQLFATMRNLEPYFDGIKSNYNKAFLLDLCRILVQQEYFTDNLLDQVGNQGFTRYRDLSSAYAVLSYQVKQMSRDLFHEFHFKKWREDNQKAFLKQKREEEIERGSYAKPYLDYLDTVEREQFALFWERHRLELLTTFLIGRPTSNPELVPYEDTFYSWHKEISYGAHRGLPWHKQYLLLSDQIEEMDPELAHLFLKSMRSFQELDRPLVNRYRNLRTENGRSLEKHLAAAFYPRYGFGYARSHAFRQSSVQGSVFKLVTAYETLVQRYYKGIKISQLNPLEIIDQMGRSGNTWKIGYFLNGKPIPRIYKGGRMPKSLSRNIGRTDLVRAIEKSSNPYFALCAGDCLESPNDLVEAAKLFSYGSKTGIDLPGEIPGRLPTDLVENRTNLHATSIGQGTLVVTPLQTAVMLSTLANGGDVLKPKIVKLGVGGRSNFWQEDLLEQFDYQDSLSFIGVDFPLFSLGHQEERETSIHSVPTEVQREIDFPEPVRSLIFEGMKRVVQSTPASRMGPHIDREALDAYSSVQDHLIGKTSSSESMERWHFDRKTGVRKTTHAWFGGISYDGDEPELVVVVLLRYAGGGKDAMPLAAQMIHKWREIK